jgi:hypothetical protein
MSANYFPFRALGFRCNPFRALMPDELAAVAVLPEPVIKALEQDFRHLQIRGRKGRGKSTTLHGLMAYFEEAGLRVAYERLPRGQHHFLTGPTGLDMFFLDEAQRLSWPERWRLVRLVKPSGGNLRLVLGTHIDYRPWFALHGERLAAVSLNIPHPDHLGQIIDRRLAAFALDDPPPVSVAPEAVDWLRREFGSDHRAVEDALYRAFQRLDSPGVMTTSYLQAVLLNEPDPGQGP